MSRLNTMYPNDEFLKKMSNMFGEIDSKNETEVKQEIEQIGYKEFYRYYKEKDIYISRLKQENQQLKELINKAIKFIEDDYYTKTTINLDSIAITTDKLLKVREILKEVE